MRKVYTTRGCNWVLALAASPTLVGGLAMAEETTPTDVLEEVVVTAQRRVEDLQLVPISAEVLTGDMLENKGVQGIYTLQYAVPSLTMADYGSANVLNIRGIGRSAVDIELPSGVVLYRDGVPTFPGYFQNEPYFDIAAIEVLRGPQGTFVGKSAAGGAIFIRTAAPDLSGLKGKVEGEVGNYGQVGTTDVINIPLGDTFAVRISHREMKRDKYLVHSVTGPYTGRPGRPDLNSTRIGLLWQPQEQLVAQLRVDSSDLDFGGNLTGSYGLPLYDLVQNADFAYRDRSLRAVGDLKYTLPSGLVLSSVTGYQRTHTINNFDRNGSQTHYNRFDSQGVFKLWSEEINLISPEGQSAFSYVLGAFVQRTDSIIYDWRRKGFNITGEAGDLGGLVLSSDYPYIGLNTPYVKREDEISGFVDLKYDFSQKLQSELGVRYSRYKQSNHTDIVLGQGNAPPFIPFFQGDPELTEGDVDAKLSLTYRLDADQNIYALISRGHVTAGFNIIGGAHFDKEVIYDYEAGWKATWADGHVRTQLGAYYQTLSDYQAQFALAALPGQNVLANLGSVAIYGAEAGLQAKLGHWSIDSSLALLQSKFGSIGNLVNPSGGTIDITHAKTPFSPAVSFNLGISYALAIRDKFTVTPRVDLSHQAEELGALIKSPQTTIPTRTLINAGLRTEVNNWYVDLYGTNLSDKRYVAGIQDLGNIWYPGAPRQYGLKVGINF